ncbi:MAG: DUF1501 domain-containing protein [Planctomycetota bacterium]|jgi:uncharacterized protein (DUF1501 family)
MTTTRREFLGASLGTSTVLSCGGAAPAWLLRALAAQERHERNTVLVVLQLTGGNDGLNTIVPFTDDTYARSRPTLRLPPAKLHRINAQLGFHPRMGACARLLSEGMLTVIQGVGFPNSSRSHPAAMRVWQTADVDHPERGAGWLGRTADQASKNRWAPLPAVQVGSIAPSLALHAHDSFVPPIRTARDLVIQASPAKIGQPVSRTAEDPLLHHLRRTSAAARVASDRIETVLGDPARAGAYPNLGLASRLRTIAQLIRADLGIRIFFTELGGDGFGGFDNHANQLGNHCALLEQLSESLGAFVADLARDRLLDRVLLTTFSEFGRTLQENGRRGTNHGAAAPMILVGGKLKGGLVGAQPSLTDLDNGALKHAIDFRQVYATLLERWLGLDSRGVLGQPFAPLAILKD